MSRTWAQIVRGKPTLNPEAPVWLPQKPKVVFHAFCADCGNEADVCRRCEKLAVYDLGLCGRCFSYNMPSDSMCLGYVRASEEAEKIPFKCSPCRSASPWHWEDDKEIVSYDYVQSCFCHELSPTNVIRIARYRSLGKKHTDPVKRADEALEAYKKELKFSGNHAEALKIYASFYKNTKPSTPLKTGYVEMADFLAGQRVTGEQFFDAVRCAEAEAKGEDVSHVDPHKLSRALLQRELDYAESECALWVREIRSVVWSEKEEEELERMENHIALLRHVLALRDVLARH